MQDIYLQQGQSRKGCLRIILLLVLIIAGAVAWYLIARHRGRVAEEQAFEQELALAEQSSAVTNQDAQATGTPPDENAAASRPVPTTPSAESAPRNVMPGQPDPGPALLVTAEKNYGDKDFAAARSVCFQILDSSADPAIRARAEAILGDVHTTLVFSPYPMEEKVDYTIEPGDTLGILAKKYNTTVELIQKGNNIQGSLIRLGDRYRILNGTFSITVDKDRNDLVLSLNGRFFKRYLVGTGQYARTPTGEFKITDRVAQPTWWRPDGKRVPYGDPENLLGTHWLSLNIRGYGIHGTWEPDSVGKQSSAGCVRMVNDNIEELYTLVPIGTTVIIK